MSNSNQDNDHWWGIGIGMFCFAGAAIVYNLLAAAEASGQALRLRGIGALVYILGGKWLVSSLLVAIGLSFIVVSIRQWIKRR